MTDTVLAESSRDRGQEFARQWQAARYFASFCHADDVVLEVGHGDDQHLRYLPARCKLQLDINLACLAGRVGIAREYAALSSSPITFDAVTVGSVDVAISHHALGDVPDPYEILVRLRRALKIGGRLILVTPFDDIRSPHNRWWSRADREWHLYTWSPKNMARLLETVSFHVLSCRVRATRCSPKFYWLHRCFGRTAFRWTCDLLGFLQHRYDVVTVAYK
jgi:SAM-dependent methyltransferase